MDMPKERPLGTNRRKRRKKDTFGKKERLKRQLECDITKSYIINQEKRFTAKVSQSCPICFKL